MLFSTSSDCLAERDFLSSSDQRFAFAFICALVSGFSDGLAAYDLEVFGLSASHFFAFASISSLESGAVVDFAAR